LTTVALFSLLDRGLCRDRSAAPKKLRGAENCNLRGFSGRAEIRKGASAECGEKRKGLNPSRPAPSSAVDLATCPPPSRPNFFDAHPLKQLMSSRQAAPRIRSDNCRVTGPPAAFASQHSLAFAPPRSSSNRTRPETHKKSDRLAKPLVKSLEGCWRELRQPFFNFGIFRYNCYFMGKSTMLISKIASIYVLL